MWTISGLSGINGIAESTAQFAADNDRIFTDTVGAPPSSTINITGFTTGDNEGIIQCVSQNDRNVRGMATISVGESAYTIQCLTVTVIGNIYIQGDDIIF